MKNVFLFLLALFLVWIVWGIVMRLVATLVGAAITIGMLLLFCWLVYTVYKAMTRQKISRQPRKGISSGPRASRPRPGSAARAALT